MKGLNFVVFISVVIILLTSINFYIVKRALSVLPDNPLMKKIFIAAIFFSASAFILGRILEKYSVTFFSSSLVWIGSFWFGIMFYLFLSVLLIDLFRIVNHFILFFPKAFYNDPMRAKRIIFWSVTALVLFISVAGFINTRFPAVRKMNLEINKKARELKSLNIVSVSDIHLGTIFGKSYLKKVVNKINALNPDIILIPGDIIDEDIASVISDNVGETLRMLKAKYGVYAVTGNHEYIGGAKAAKKYLAEHNVHLLNDEYVLIDSSFYVVGREDVSKKMFTNVNRKPLDQVMTNIDKSFPIILLDHQPFKLEQAVNNGVDLQLSGHTHHGQLWPANFITEMVYEVSWGYKKKNNSHIYVSCGVGGWGPPMRTVSRPEIVQIILNFHE